MFEFFQLSLSPDISKYQTHSYLPSLQGFEFWSSRWFSGPNLQFLVSPASQDCHNFCSVPLPRNPLFLLGSHQGRSANTLGKSGANRELHLVYFLAWQDASPKAQPLGSCVVLLRGLFFNFHPEFLVVLGGRFSLAQAGASWPAAEFLRHDIFSPSSLCHGQWCLGHQP